MTNYCEKLKDHYSKIWGNSPVIKKLMKGPVQDLPQEFGILEFPPTLSRHMWTYATCCMSQPEDKELLELHMFSPIQSEKLVELLTITAHFHRTGELLGLGHTINFGCPWFVKSKCDHGLVSLPYLDGPAIERCEFSMPDLVVQCLWLIPITKAERDFKKLNGLEALEARLEEKKFNYLDPYRPSVA